MRRHLAIKKAHDTNERTIAESDTLQIWQSFISECITEVPWCHDTSVGHGYQANVEVLALHTKEAILRIWNIDTQRRAVAKHPDLP